MRILSTVTVPTSFAQEHPEIIKNELRQNICKELTKFDLFIEPPLKCRDNKTEVSMMFFVIGFDEINKLEELANKYPEISGILQEIVINKVQ
jgi:hypothetical protein